MASGDTLLKFPVRKLTRVAVSTGTQGFMRGSHAIATADDAVSETIGQTSIMPQHYGAGGIDLILHWAATPTSGNIIIQGVFLRIGDDVNQVDGSSGNGSMIATAAIAVPANSGDVKITTIPFLQSEIHGIVAGDMFGFGFFRSASTATGDVQWKHVELRET